MTDKQLADVVVAAKLSAATLEEKVFIVSMGARFRFQHDRPTSESDWKMEAEVYPGGRVVDWRNVKR